jgi:hypothetical protein
MSRDTVGQFTWSGLIIAIIELLQNVTANNDYDVTVLQALLFTKAHA